jgi:hypothetical protein
MMSKLWWGHKGNDAKIAWMHWSKLRRAKEKGGLGFRDIELFNLALLAKQGWRPLQQPDSLVAQIFKEKYYPNCSFLESNLGRQPSYAWHGIAFAIPNHFLRRSLCGVLGMGHQSKSRVTDGYQFRELTRFFLQ